MSIALPKIDCHKLRVAICGGGISGLCLAVLLSQYNNIDVQVYEAAERFKEIGAGVMIWTRTWQIIERMGLADEFSKISHAPPDGSLGVGFDFRKSDQKEHGFRFHIVEVPNGCIRFHRAQFLDVFANRLPDGVAHFGKRLQSFDRNVTTGTVSLHFEDGSLAECDVIIGCDGIKSVVRKHLYQIESSNFGNDLNVEPIWSGIMAYRGLIPAWRLRPSGVDNIHSAAQRPMMYCGKSKHIVAYSIAKGDIINVITFASDLTKENACFNGPWVEECSKQELLDCYMGWEPEVMELLHCIDSPTKWALHQLPSLPFYVSDNVALVGDSAHAMLPHQGAGAGQAIEDAYVLSHILGNKLTTKATLRHALSAYEAVRLPAASQVLSGSKESGLLYEFNHPDLGQDYESLGPRIEKQWDWVWANQPDDDVKRALDLFRSKCNTLAGE